MPPRKRSTANPIVGTFWRFAAFFRCLHVVIVCMAGLLSHHRSSVIYSSLKDYRQKPEKTLDTNLTISIRMAASYFSHRP
jgi:Golgi nucleoside diphosphatase